MTTVPVLAITPPHEQDPGHIAGSTYGPKQWAIVVVLGTAHVIFPLFVVGFFHFTGRLTTAPIGEYSTT
jgi:hypothetical protein